MFFSLGVERFCLRLLRRRLHLRAYWVWSSLGSCGALPWNPWYSLQARLMMACQSFWFLRSDAFQSAPK